MDKNIKNQNKDNWWQDAMFIFFKLSIWIVGPILAGVFIGKYLDERYDSTPWLFLLSVGIAFIVSITGLVKNTLAEFKKIENTSPKNGEATPKDGQARKKDKE